MFGEVKNGRGVKRVTSLNEELQKTLRLLESMGNTIHDEGDAECWETKKARICSGSGRKELIGKERGAGESKYLMRKKVKSNPLQLSESEH